MCYILLAWSPTKPVSGDELCRCDSSTRAARRFSLGDAGVELYLTKDVININVNKHHGSFCYRGCFSVVHITYI